MPPKGPLDAAIDTVNKLLELHTKAEQVRESFDRIDPIKIATSTVDNLTEKIDQLDSINAKTRRRRRRFTPRQE